MLNKVTIERTFENVCLQLVGELDYLLQLRAAACTRGMRDSVKRGLFHKRGLVNGTRGIYTAKEACVQGTYAHIHIHIHTHTHTAKEAYKHGHTWGFANNAYISGKKDLFIRQKRPTCMAKEAYLFEHSLPQHLLRVNGDAIGRDILTHTVHTHDVAGEVEARGRVEQQVNVPRNLWQFARLGFDQ